MPSSNPAYRAHFVDPLRIFLMVLGVVLHAAHVFSPIRHWRINSPHTITVCYYLIEAIYRFRMPTFFLIAGLSYTRMIQAGRVRGVLQDKFRRIGIPLLATAAIFNSLEAFVLHLTDWRMFNVPAYLTEGGWMSHLWFLACMLCYFTLAEALRQWVLPRLPRREALLNAMEKLPPQAVLLALPGITLLMLTVFKLGVPGEWRLIGTVDLYTLSDYLPFFAFGALLGLRSDLLRLYCRFGVLFTLGVLGAAAAAELALPHQQTLWRSAAHAYLESLMSWSAIFVLLGVFSRFMDKPSTVWSRMGDLSYSVYLFHHFLVVVFGVVLIRLDVSAGIGFPLLMLLALLGAVTLHKQVVARSAWLQWLFNGRSRPGRARIAARPDSVLDVIQG